MNRFHIIGLSDHPQQVLSADITRLIASHRIFSGGIRHRELIKDRLPDQAVWIDIKVPLDLVFKHYMQYADNEEMVIFASGDPLFFGFATTVQNRLPKADIRLYPTFNSLQMLAHQLVMPYQDMRVVSLTGRSWHEFDRALIEGTTQLGILTDHEHTPAAIALRMLEFGYHSYTFYIGEHLGNPQAQQIRRMNPEEASLATFATPNCLILVKGASGRPRPLGIEDSLFEHLDGREKMITKMPVRLLSLSLLDLRERSVFWDIGFCTGSVSIEAKLQFPHLHITAFEVREEGRRLMEVNTRRWGTPGIAVRIGDFCKADLSGIEPPDAVFIGGHGGKLIEIMQCLAGKLKKNGVVVFNSVSDESKELFTEAVRQTGMQIQHQTSITIDNNNKITILKAVMLQ